ncbi:MAG: glycosyltransferase family 4 protein, partial [Arenimonas sp.]
MTIVFVNRYGYPDHSATSQIMSDLAASLASSGLSVAMVTSRLVYDDQAVKLPGREKWKNVDIHRIWTSRFGRTHLLGRMFDYLTFYLSLPWTLMRELQRGDVVIAKTDPPLVSLVVAVVAKLRGAVLVNWLQDVFPELVVAMGEPKIPKLLTDMLRRLRNKSLQLAATNVVIGDRMSEYFHSQGIASECLRVIHNWAHEDDIVPMLSSRSTLRQSLNLADKFVVGYSGNLGRAHDVETLFEAARILSDTCRIVFLMIGGGHGYQQLQQRVQEVGLTSIIFLPYQPLEKLSDSMAAADLHLVS